MDVLHGDVLALVAQYMRADDLARLAAVRREWRRVFDREWQISGIYVPVHVVACSLNNTLPWLEELELRAKRPRFGDRWRIWVSGNWEKTRELFHQLLSFRPGGPCELILHLMHPKNCGTRLYVVGVDSCSLNRTTCLQFRNVEAHTSIRIPASKYLRTASICIDLRPTTCAFIVADDCAVEVLCPALWRGQRIHCDTDPRWMPFATVLRHVNEKPDAGAPGRPA